MSVTEMDDDHLASYFIMLAKLAVSTGNKLREVEEEIMRRTKENDSPKEED